MDSGYRAWKEDEISLGELFAIIRRAKWLLLASPPIFALAGFGAAYVVPKQYAASIIVAPSDNEEISQSRGLSTLASQFGDIASLAGVSLPSNTKTAETVAVLQSQALTERYIDNNHLLPVLFHKLWDPYQKAWRTTAPDKLPTLWKANQYFEKRVRSISTDTKTGLVTLTITWTNSQQAAQWANGLVEMTNNYLRSKAIQESQRNIAYLNDQAAKTDAVGVKQAIYSLMESEINKVMLARGNDEYALKVIDPAQAPERPSFPRPVVWTLVGFFAGVLAAFLTAILRLNAIESRPRSLGQTASLASPH